MRWILTWLHDSEEWKKVGALFWSHWHRFIIPGRMSRTRGPVLASWTPWPGWWKEKKGNDGYLAWSLEGEKSAFSIKEREPIAIEVTLWFQGCRRREPNRQLPRPKTPTSFPEIFAEHITPRRKHMLKVYWFQVNSNASGKRANHQYGKEWVTIATSSVWYK